MLARLVLIFSLILGSVSSYELGLFNGTTTEEVRSLYCCPVPLRSSHKMAPAKCQWRRGLRSVLRPTICSPSLRTNLQRGVSTC